MKRIQNKIKGFFSILIIQPLKFSGLIKLYAISSVILMIVSCSDENLIQQVQDYNTEPPEPYFFNVVSTDPAASSIDITLNADINVAFDDNIDISSISSSTFIVNDGGPVSGAFSYDPLTKTVTFNPGTDFTVNTLYTVTLTTGITNVSGETMFSDYTWSFTTTTASDPEIKITSPLIELFTGDTFDFGSALNFSTTPIDFTAYNTGTGNLDINSLLLSGTDSDQFTISFNPAPVTINPGLNNTFTVDFTPTTTGIKNAVLTITNTDPDEGTFTINLTGISLIAGAPEIQVTRNGTILISNFTVVNYGTVHRGNSITKTFIMSNIGSNDLNITGYNITGSNPSHYSTDFSPVPAIITAGSTKTFNITFSPHSKGWKYADINFQNDDSDESPFVIKVKGRGN